MPTHATAHSIVERGGILRMHRAQGISISASQRKERSERYELKPQSRRPGEE
jgi:hypothetical protein